MIPDAIIVCSAGTVPYDENGRVQWRTTTYDDRDAFGTLGGRDRVEAAALLAQRYPEACIVTTSRRITGEAVTLARVYADEMVGLGVARDRIIEETTSVTGRTQVEEAARLATEKGWKHILFLSSGYQLPRLAGFFEQIKNKLTVDFVSSESILTAADAAFAKRFAEVQQSVAYQERLAAEARGIAALKEGIYKSAAPEDKRER